MKAFISKVMIILKIGLTFLFVYTIVFDLFYSAGGYIDRTIFLGVLLGCLLAVFLNLGSKTIFSFAIFLLLLLGYETVVASQSLIIGRITIWIYVVVVIGLMRQFIELKKASH